MIDVMYPEAFTAEYEEAMSLLISLSEEGGWPVSPASPLAPKKEGRTMNEATVSQNSETGHWTCTHEEQSADFGRGPLAKHHAYWLQLKINNPAIAIQVDKLLTAWPLKSLEVRAQRGAILAAQGHVHPITPGNGLEAFELMTLAAVKSSRRDHTYYIQFDDERNLMCSCPDYQQDRAPVAAGHRLCKHVIAFCITTSLQSADERQTKEASNGHRVSATL